MKGSGLKPGFHVNIQTAVVPEPLVKVKFPFGAVGAGQDMATLLVVSSGGDAVESMSGGAVESSSDNAVESSGLSLLAVGAGIVAHHFVASSMEPRSNTTGRTNNRI